MSNAHSHSPAAGWFKSSLSNPSQECVEVKLDGNLVHIRDSKDHGAGPVITIGVEHWPGVLAEALGRDNAGSNRAVRIERGADGSVQLQSLGSNVLLTYTSAEWAAFVAGAEAGEFDCPATERSLVGRDAA